MPKRVKEDNVHGRFFLNLMAEQRTAKNFRVVPVGGVHAAQETLDVLVHGEVDACALEICSQQTFFQVVHSLG